MMIGVLEGVAWRGRVADVVWCVSPEGRRAALFPLGARFLAPGRAPVVSVPPTRNGDYVAGGSLPPKRGGPSSCLPPEGEVAPSGADGGAA